MPTYVIRAFGGTLVLSSGISSSQILTLLDSIAASITAFNATIIVGTNSQLQAINTGAANLTTRIAASSDFLAEEMLLNQANASLQNIQIWQSSILTITNFYAQFFSFFNTIDLFLSGGLNTYLTSNSLQVNAWVAAAFNYWAAQSPNAMNRVNSSPIPIATANIFPYAAVDPMISFTTGTGTTMTSSTAGSASSTQGGGVGPLYLYKTSTGNAAGSATLTITYTNAAGASVTVPVSTTGITGGAANVNAGGAVNLNVNAQAVTSVTGTGMTPGEIYRVGTRLLRTVTY